MLKRCTFWTNEGILRIATGLGLANVAPQDIAQYIKREVCVVVLLWDIGRDSLMIYCYLRNSINDGSRGYEAKANEKFWGS